jgi:hypothetical protein
MAASFKATVSKRSKSSNTNRRYRIAIAEPKYFFVLKSSFWIRILIQFLDSYLQFFAFVLILFCFEKEAAVSAYSCVVRREQ